MLKGTMRSGRAARWQQTSRSATSHNESLRSSGLQELRSRDEASRFLSNAKGTEVTAPLPSPSGKAACCRRISLLEVTHVCGAYRAQLRSCGAAEFVEV